MNKVFESWLNDLPPGNRMGKTQMAVDQLYYIQHKMKTTPQHVTERYIHRLLTRGRNDIFELESLTQRIATHDNIPVGIFFEANVKRSLGFENQVAAGATPREAVRRSLEKHGVTFR